MDELLAALKAGDEEKVNYIACGLFITEHGRCNWDAISKFEEFAGCRIYPVEKDCFGWLIGGILFEGKEFCWG
jgi:hypothetical protein